ncbi:hypothetical protein LMH87_011001 [Akanthomyces muscarius]|uniref:Zn(2)-C6 fungal-type domain-containing protein n=1 Tax=Akanthomyces muscarius TaxID=2231603 RepID=A0A9W8UI20_AKAMU|nr:hypothetical protein LMH87_011001 [Akanthomyces muscarius]KAJ4150243.1 hypothetical protein LMH87_011001 [Akanthomyces muscarius]
MEGTQRYWEPVTHNNRKAKRRQRVRQACGRCRMKKIKCDNEMPQLPKGYTEALEDSQLVLTATVHKLYSLVRRGRQWTLEEPKLNSHDQPIAHDIAQLLGCMRRNDEIDQLAPQQNSAPDYSADNSSSSKFDYSPTSTDYKEAA